MDQVLPTEYLKAFKDADIRGLTVREIDDDLAYAIARAFVTEFQYETVLVGYDMRISSPAIVEAFAQGVLDVGANVINIGLAHTPLLYFASGSKQLPGVMVTASHSPAEYNGLKLVKPDAIPLTSDTGLNAILERIQSNQLGEGTREGSRSAEDLREPYAAHIAKNWDTTRYKDLRIVVDAGNGMGSILYPLLTKDLGITAKLLYGDFDGRLPNRGSDPTLKENQTAIVNELQTGNYDFGIAFDGDADRVAFFDKQGNFINCASIGALIADNLTTHRPQSKFVFTNLTSRVYEETIKKAGAEALRARVGHTFIKEKMRAESAEFGCEHSGHFFFKEFFYTDSVLLTLRYVLEIFNPKRLDGMTLSQLIKPYQPYVQLEDRVIDVQDKMAVLRAVKNYVEKQYPQARITEFDGLLVELEDAWGGVKPSVTEHAIKVMFEGKTAAAAEVVQTDIVQEVKRLAEAET